ncbi:octanoyltransferase [Vibrio sp. UCD-FRSSP16_10]|uniref:lipoyl(octanoyl) transferase LipB n=1 Tax=unclassified Vibrio TaxID=2614977 RepID=UPI0007FBBDBE|nr:MULTISPECIES: lipoyl(octanoyl) transferase LipB [unclassified Vibrio]OBT12895.1 octanoyltransferase [Vibrio sp. UCD-FRSSP16_30]OBT18231.1 octanoyltransferase [Vibrio sp. UCD-FRSSP16_10]
MVNKLEIIHLGRQDYEPIWEKMHEFTNERDEHTADQVWIVEHNPVFTQGQAGKAEHLLHTGDIPVVKSDRGGQVTYHGPGQMVVYFLLNLRRRNLGVRELVTDIENIVIQSLAKLGINSAARPDAPGVYVDNKKICSLGLRIRRGCSFHGLALNIDMDLSPFLRINPCGYAGMEMAQVADFTSKEQRTEIQSILVKELTTLLNYTDVTEMAESDE